MSIVVEIDRGWRRETRVRVEAKRITPEILEVGCIECDGTGVFPYHPEGGSAQCVECKGTGKIYVS